MTRLVFSGGLRQLDAALNQSKILLDVSFCSFDSEQVFTDALGLLQCSNLYRISLYPFWIKTVIIAILSQKKASIIMQYDLSHPFIM